MEKTDKISDHQLQKVIFGKLNKKQYFKKSKRHWGRLFVFMGMIILTLIVMFLAKNIK